jgi:hypothetical protein
MIALSKSHIVSKTRVSTNNVIAIKSVQIYQMVILAIEYNQKYTVNKCASWIGLRQNEITGKTHC